MSDISKSVLATVAQKLRFDEKPITKKAACEMLGIAYNTARLDKLVNDFLEEKERTKTRRQANRGKLATDYEIATAIEDYLGGEAISAISSRLCRSTLFVKSILERCGIPLKDTNCSYFNPQLLNEDFIQEYLEPNTVVYSALHQELGSIKKVAPSGDRGTAYWVRLASEQYVAIMWYDLLPMDSLIAKYKLKFALSSGLDTKTILSQTLSKALKNDQ